MQRLSHPAKFKIFIVIALTLFPFARAAALDWTFAPQRAGRALIEGGWTQEFVMDGVKATPEFQFPLQIVYLSTREDEGIFGPQWFCPQLESAVIPRERGAFVWQMPSGGAMPFFDNRDLRCYTNPSGEWHADVVGRRVVISNREGWKYLYKSGKIMAVVSPTDRVLNFKYNGSDLTTVELRDARGGATMKLIDLSGPEQNRKETEQNRNRRRFKTGLGCWKQRGKRLGGGRSVAEADGEALPALARLVGGWRSRTLRSRRQLCFLGRLAWMMIPR